MAVYKRERKLKSGTKVFWQAIVDLPPDPNDLDAKGKPKRRQRAESFPTEREAKKREREWLNEIDRGIVIDHTPKTVADVLTHWLDTHSPNLKPKTQYEYDRIIKQHILPALGSIPVQKLTRARVEQFYNDKRAAGVGYRTIQLCHERISQALDHAVDLDLVPRNVAARARYPKAPREERAIWSETQQQAFIAAARNSTYGPIWPMILLSGMRRGEVLALRWEDVDFERGTVYVHRTVGTVGNRLVEGEPKTKNSRRTVPLRAGLMQALKAHHEHYLKVRAGMGEEWQDHGLVFFSGTGGYIHPRNLRREFDRWVKVAGVPRIAIHDLRHSYATSALENGASILDVSKHLGHARPSITSDIYAHVLNQDHSRVADKVGAWFEEDSGPDVVQNVVRFQRKRAGA